MADMEGPSTTTVARSPKRTHDQIEPLISTPERAPPSEAPSTPLTDLSTVPSPSPAKTPSAATPVHSAPNLSATQQPAKRRKLTTQEKEDQRLEKEAKDKARAEKKTQREAEDKAKADIKAQKDEQKRLKDEEKRKKNEEREEKKRAKELEQQQKEEEKRKKERSQMKLNAFFVKPKSGLEKSVSTMVDTVRSTDSETVSPVPDVELTDANTTCASPQKSKSDYERTFLPFQLHSHSILAPYNRFQELQPKDREQTLSAQNRFANMFVQGKDLLGNSSVESFTSQFGSRRKRGLQTPSISELVDQINGSRVPSVVDLTKERDTSPKNPLDLLKQIPMKYLHFQEDVRPPYYGTFTRDVTAEEGARLSRNPLSRTLNEIEYDYDSEAEWEEPEEGEDLDSEGDDEMSEDGDDDMEGFLDDEDDAQVKRRLISGDQAPVSTGLCWEDVEGVSRLNDGSGAISTEFKDFRMGFLLEPQPTSIDPFSTAYWAPVPKAAPATQSMFSKDSSSTNAAMQPPRMPLSQRPINGLLVAHVNGSPSINSKPAKPAKRLIPTEQLAAFKAEVEGSDLTKIALIEALKKKFPKLPKDAISNTLSTVAARKGPKEAEKRWILIQ
ncbi:hypothetical protein BU24DRAFT_446244 [Aaosphaeria arxii CBS 175.79]|uniref:Chromatin assembly factor 1 subunit A n=1 Tax=Aaosphaeria arxii CBS 175.79 TaxID=1450172 RepID=A0A6A5Y993_9PLEO|nr:uncharacterized protein BU24DRAFT_446244 [Aaosphaeria arxii CBS 175.79]KAF2021164.1 hypothetical protein BU24DRAFT_446244 [Aaosphaeria arxii CBS 175.79]